MGESEYVKASGYDHDDVTINKAEEKAYNETNGHWLTDVYAS